MVEYVAYLTFLVIFISLPLQFYLSPQSNGELKYYLTQFVDNIRNNEIFGSVLRNSVDEQIDDTLGEDQYNELLSDALKEDGLSLADDHFASSTDPRDPKPPFVKYSVGQVFKHTGANDRPHYLALIDSRDRHIPQMGYVAEENINIVEGQSIIHPLIQKYFERFNGRNYDLHKSHLNFTCSFLSLPTTVNVHWKFKPKGESHWQHAPCKRHQEHTCNATSENIVEILGLSVLEVVEKRFVKNQPSYIELCANPQPILFFINDDLILQPGESSTNHAASPLSKALKPLNKTTGVHGWDLACYRSRLLISSFGDEDRYWRAQALSADYSKTIELAQSSSSNSQIFSPLLFNLLASLMFTFQ
ncbi:Hemimethylated DNA binding domain-containing protein [Aphelenchoides besseyi]|nr:Hemimethylated DNA binding domain-containing protein [Aphelenchoides besseyi]